MRFSAGATPIPDLANPAEGLGGLVETWRRFERIPFAGPLAAFERVDSAAHYVRRIVDIWPKQLAEQPLGDALTRDLQRLLDRWWQDGDRAVLAEPQPVVLSRGDANLLNWLHDPTRGTTGCVDWEFAGGSDPAFDVADLVEHISARQISDDAWSKLVPQLSTAPSPSQRFNAAQRTCALRWLAVLWKQRASRTEEFSVQLDRVRRLQQGSLAISE